ncbi:MAG: phosphoribosyltransferase [Candidatus Thermoplasmatota archaeon]|jgi:xanthine phosphoribosyltransferase|uniref:phosphoribosyltransferase n=1 Tax=Ferroplasma sp. TaxID=2591003 RepID=UPI0026398400|nr:phosphoribosyltransferase [Ferroplasma sp.]MCL4312243.1 phosphoribosyltransferase [Candidatus Thermoplasmatota archaeon]
MEFKATYVSWKEIEEWTKGIRKMVVENNYNPDIIIGIARGGLVPARMVADYLFKKDLLSIKTEHWGLTATMNGKAVLKEKLNYDVTGKKVLIVDDITDTGESMKLSYNYVKSINPADVKTTSMLYIDGSNYTPDFYGKGLSKEEWAWFVFPWNVYEDTFNLSKKFMDVPVGVGELKEKLAENYGLNVEDIDLEEVLENIAALKMLKRHEGKFSIP